MDEDYVVLMQEEEESSKRGLGSRLGSLSPPHPL